MKKKIILTIVSVLLIALCVISLSACTNKYKQDAIATDYSSTVTSNGGMAVVYGKYLYFINGLAGKDADNTFGKVVKGSISRVELVGGKPSGSPTVIVPMNVYGTDTAYGGIYISNDYIYFATTNSAKNGSGEAKVDEMVIMRSKVDGSGTEEVFSFSDHTVVFKVSGNNLVYIRNNRLNAIDLSGKKFYSKLVEGDTILTGYKFTENYLIYMQYNDNNSSDYLLKAYKLDGASSPVTILNSEKVRTKDNALYTFSILNAIEDNGKLNVVYTMTDNGLNTPDVGIYSYSFPTDSFAYDKAKQVRYTRNTSSTTNLAFSGWLDAGNYYLAISDKTIAFFDKVTGEYLKNGDENAKIVMSAAVTLFKTEKTADGVFLWYQDSNKAMYKVKVFDKDGKFVEGNTVCIFSGSYDATYTSIDVIGDVIYYFNSKVSNNAYSYVIPEISTITSDTDVATGKILGTINDVDKVAAL